MGTLEETGVLEPRKERWCDNAAEASAAKLLFRTTGTSLSSLENSRIYMGVARIKNTEPNFF